MTVEELGELAAEVAERRGRNEKIEILEGALRKADASELALLVTLLSGELPGGKIGVGPAAVSKLAKEKLAGGSGPGLDLQDLRDELARIAELSGKGSQAARHQALVDLLLRTGPRGQAFLLDLLAGGLRIGALAGVVEAAVVKLASVSSSAMRRAVTLSGSLARAALTALDEGEAGLSRFQIELFRPLAPMLASPCDSPETVLARWSPVLFEVKLDGIRVQVHRDGDKVRIYSRALHDITTSLPEVVEAVLALPVRRLVLDGEVLSLDSDGRARPFQETMKRLGRTPLSPFFFDILLADDTEFLDRPLSERRTALSEFVPESLRVRGEIFSEAEVAQSFFDETVEAGFEGAMAKNLQGMYEAGRRGSDWLKLKPVHTLDLVVVAAEWGSGRRRGWLSNLHLAAPDQDGQLIMLGKTFKGLTDELLAWQTEQLLSREVSREGETVHVRPELVIEIAFNDLQVSPRYPGGLALRFARVRRYRPDKDVSQADSFESVRLLHLAHCPPAELSLE